MSQSSLFPLPLGPHPCAVAVALYCMQIHGMSDAHSTHIPASAVTPLQPGLVAFVCQGLCVYSCMLSVWVGFRTCVCACSWDRAYNKVVEGVRQSDRQSEDKQPTPPT